MQSKPGSEVTARALLAGVLIGAVLAVGNVYLGLKTGFWDGGSITASIVAFAVFVPLARLGVSPFSKLEDNLAQTAASSCAAMPAAMGFLGALPAIDLLGQRYGGVEVALWGLAVGLFGIAVAIPLRERLVVEERLPFPTATATREVIEAIYTQDRRALGQVYALAAAAVLAMLIAWFRDARPALLPQELALPIMIAGLPAASFTLGVSVSPMLASAGALVGMRVAVGLGIGALIAWAGAAPVLYERHLVASADYAAIVAWLLWPGVALMIAGTLTSQLPALLGLGRAARDLLRAGGRTRTERTWPLLLVASAVAIILFSWTVFGVHPLISLAIVPLTVLFSGLCARSSGETDIAPLGPVGQAAQVALGLTAPASATVNLAAAGVVAGAAAQTVQTMQSYKVGADLGARPSRTIIAQLVGAGFGALISVPAYRLLCEAYGLGSAALPVPYALGWKVLGELSEKGTAVLPPGAGPAAIVGLVAGVLLALGERTRFAKWVPSPLSIGVAFLIPAASIAAIVAGALLTALVAWKWPRAVERYLTSFAAGGIAGEGVISLVIAFLLVSGVFGRH